MNNQRLARPTSVRIRQVALCTDDIWREEQRIVAELGVAAVHRDPPNLFKMRNSVFVVGDTFLEVLQPESDDAPAARFLSRRGDPGGYMLIMQVDDLAAVRARVAALEIRVVHDATPERVHGVDAAALHLHPGDTGGAIMSFDQMDPADGWAWAGRTRRESRVDRPRPVRRTRPALRQDSTTETAGTHHDGHSGTESNSDRRCLGLRARDR